MRTCLFIVRVLICAFVLSAGASLYAQWNQWAHDAQHTGYLPDVAGQPLTAIKWMAVIDATLAEPPAEITIHYSAPLIDADGNVFMTYKDRISGVNHYYVKRYDQTGGVVWTYETDYVPPRASWESVLHPVLANGYLYVPGARAVLHVVDPNDGTEIDTISDYEIPPDEQIRQQLLNTVSVAGVPTVDDDGNIYYPIMVKSGAPADQMSRFVKYSTDGTFVSVTYASLLAEPTERGPVNAGAAIAPDGTIYIGSVRPGVFQPSESWLLALNPDLTLKWKGSLAADSARRAYLIDDSSSCPVVGPDGRVFFGGWDGHEISRGYLYSFSPDGDFLGTFDFGWDTTPAIYPSPDPSNGPAYYLVQKDNHYSNPPERGPYYMTTINPDTMQAVCKWELMGREWCINAPAIDMNGVVYTNGEDGYLYALSGMYPNPDGSCTPIPSRIQLNRARDAAYTPLALGPDGTVYSLNDGRMFAVGNPPNK